MMPIKTNDDMLVYVATSSRVNGPPRKGSADAGGLHFGTHYAYVSWDDGANWHKTDERSHLGLSSFVTEHSLAELKEYCQARGY